MSFVDSGIILDVRPYGETHGVAHIFTEHYGRRVGLVHGGQGRRMRPILQPGNEVKADWKGRADSLGHFMLEMVRARAAEAMDERISLAALSAACATALSVLPEGEAHERAFRGMIILLDNIDDGDLWPALMARWELGLLAELGFGLTLDKCVATNVSDELVYVSPRSACAVSRSAGEPYKEKLLKLPGFLKDGQHTASLEDALAGLNTTGFFLETRILHLSDKQLPESRRRIVDLLNKQQKGIMRRDEISVAGD